MYDAEVFILASFLIVIVWPIPGKSTNANEPLPMAPRKIRSDSIALDSESLYRSFNVHQSSEKQKQKTATNQHQLWSQPLNKQLSRKSTPCIICACSFHFWNWNRVEKVLVIDCVRVFVYVLEYSNVWEYVYVCKVGVCFFHLGENV